MCVYKPECTIKKFKDSRVVWPTNHKQPLSCLLQIENLVRHALYQLKYKFYSQTLMLQSSRILQSNRVFTVHGTILLSNTILTSFCDHAL